jgi:hypothetical protein
VGVLVEGCRVGGRLGVNSYVALVLGFILRLTRRFRDVDMQGRIQELVVIEFCL